MKHIFMPVIFLVFGFFPLFAQTSYTESEKSLIQDVLSKRIELRTTADLSESLSKVNGFFSTVRSSDSYKNASKEVKIVVDNLLTVAKYNILYEQNDKDPELKTLVISQYNIIDSYRTENKKTTFNPWFYLSSGDIVNVSLQFLSRAQAIKEGLQEKSDYDDVIKSNPTMSYALTNAGLWYYFAPGIGGGSKKKARDLFLRASQNASNPYEKYYANIYLSQCYVENKNAGDAKKYLALAESAVSGTSYISFIQKLNDQGFSLFDYISNKAKLDSRVK